MRLTDIEDGYCYVMDDDVEKICNTINTSFIYNKGGLRPYVIIKEGAPNGMVWAIPLSTSIATYKKHEAKAISKYGRCDKFVFTKFAGRRGVAVIDCAFPVTPNYITNVYRNNSSGKAVPLNKKVYELICRKFVKIMNIRRFNGINFFMYDIDAIKKKMQELDYRPACELSTEEFMKVVNHKYSAVLNRAKTEAQYAAAVEKIARKMLPKKDILFNPHNMKQQVVRVFRLGIDFNRIKANGAPFYIQYDSAYKATIICSKLSEAGIEYSAAIKESDRGTITIDKKNIQAFRKIEREVLNNREVIDYKLSYNPKTPEIYLSAYMKSVDGCVLSHKLKSLNVPHYIKFRGKNAEIFFYRNDKLTMEYISSRLKIPINIHGSYNQNMSASLIY